MTLLQAAERTHDELGCLDVDLLLGDVMAENAALKVRLVELGQQVAAERHRAEMAQSLHLETEKRFRVADEDREALAAQVKILHEELTVTEKDALPVGTVVYGTVSRDEVLGIYRRVSRIFRGPAPHCVSDAVESAAADVRAAMEAAGREAVEVVVRREVRRRRRASRR